MEDVTPRPETVMIMSPTLTFSDEFDNVCSCFVVTVVPEAREERHLDKDETSFWILQQLRDDRFENAHHTFYTIDECFVWGTIHTLTHTGHMKCEMITPL